MTTSTDAIWPNYPVGPRECIFALGVVAINYARLEFALSGVLSTVVGTDRDATSLFLAKSRNPERLSKMRRSLKSLGWPDDVLDLVNHFIDGFDACARNRNVLMHSNVFITEDAIIVYRSDRSGKTLACNPTLSEIRRVADELSTFFDYGIMLTNTINVNLIMADKMRTIFPWPAKPPLPHILTYTGDSQVVRGLHDDK